MSKVTTKWIENAAVTKAKLNSDVVTANGGIAGSNGNPLTLDINGMTAETTPDNADSIAIYDSTAGAHRKQTRGQFLGSNAYPSRTFFADQLDSPCNSDWVINALAPLSADPSKNALKVRLFDDTAEEGVGFLINLPSGATNMVFGFKSRAITAPGSEKKVALNFYARGIPDNAAVEAWGSEKNINDVIIIPTNAYFQYDTTSISFSTLGITAGRLYQIEITRDGDDATYDTLVGDWGLAELSVSFS